MTLAHGRYQHFFENGFSEMSRTGFWRLKKHVLEIFRAKSALPGLSPTDSKSSLVEWNLPFPKPTPLAIKPNGVSSSIPGTAEYQLPTMTMMPLLQPMQPLMPQPIQPSMQSLLQSTQSSPQPEQQPYYPLKMSMPPINLPPINVSPSLGTSVLPQTVGDKMEPSVLAPHILPQLPGLPNLYGMDESQLNPPNPKRRKTNEDDRSFDKTLLLGPLGTGKLSSDRNSNGRIGKFLFLKISTR